MPRKPLANLPEVFLSDSSISKHVSRAAARGEARKIGPRLYTTNTELPAEEIVRRNVWQIAGLLFPGAVVAHRTALESKPSPEGVVFLSAPHSRIVRLPGHTFRLIEGPGALEGDNRFVQDLWLASKARAFLENLKPTRNRSTVTRAIPRPELEDRLERILRIGGAEELNRLRDRAKSLAKDLNARKEYEALNDIVGTLLGTRQATVTSTAAVARIAGSPYDPEHLDILQTLHAELVALTAVPRPGACATDDCRRNLAFFDAYFSNYIEGTEFEIDEAREIVFEGRIPATRPEDAHDVLGTFRLLSNPEVMKRSAGGQEAEAGQFVALLRERHVTIMEARPDVRPGKFKTQPNRAGETFFVQPDLVLGTLERGFELFRSLDTPFARAAFVMFLVTQVHPFDDGNGRVARVMMNAELEAGDQAHILVPTVYRDDYLGALRALSRSGHPDPFIQMLDYAQRFTSMVDFSDFQAALTTLTAARAFEDHRSMRLIMPAQT